MRIRLVISVQNIDLKDIEVAGHVMAYVAFKHSVAQKKTLSCLIQQEFHLRVEYNNATETVSKLTLSSVEIHGVEASPTSVTINDSRWNSFSHTTATQVSTVSSHLTPRASSVLPRGALLLCCC